MEKGENKRKRIEEKMRKWEEEEESSEERKEKRLRLEKIMLKIKIRKGNMVEKCEKNEEK